ncbi:MAG: hypothetical protein AAGA48_20995 [Myxococcota bacterium]
MMVFLLALGTTASAAPVKIAGAEAKSFYSEKGSTYLPGNVHDRSTQPWFEGEPGSGVGSWVKVDLGGEHTVTTIKMWAGDWTSHTYWSRANRPKMVEVKYSDGSTEIWELTDEWKVQTFTPKTPKKTSSIRFKINALYSGTAFPDAAISEIQIFDDQPGKTVTVKTASASSEFPSDDEGMYDALQAADGVKDTMWCEGDKETEGLGQWVEFQLAEATTISSMKVCPGMCASLAIHKTGNMPSQMTVDFGDGSTQKIELKDLPLDQPIRFEAPHKTDKVKLTIDAVRKGTKFNDTCLSDVTFNR